MLENKKKIKRDSQKKPPRSRARILVFFLILMLVAALPTTFAAYTKNHAESQSDFSALPWTEAFAKLHDRLSAEYAFTDWKEVDWDSLYSEYSVIVAGAEKNDDFDGYYVALRSYLHQVQDKHISCSNLSEIDDKYIGGGFGVAVAKLENGQLIFTWVDEQSPAYWSGIRPGMQLISWNGLDPGTALEETTTIFTAISATDEDRDLQRQTYLVRAPIGDQVKIVFQNGDAEENLTATLTARADGFESLHKGYPDAAVSDRLKQAALGIETDEPMPTAMVETEFLDGDVFYIRLWGEFDADLEETGVAPSTLELFRNAVDQAIDAEAKGIVLDLRNNAGGLDKMAADILGSFYSEKTFYEYQNEFDFVTGTRSLAIADEEAGTEALYINPAQNVYSGPVVALTNTRTVSSGEGIALGIKNLPNGETLGFYGTNGSFGLTGPEALMPGDLLVRWPAGQSLDENKIIQLDSRGGVGGVSPSIRIPVTSKNAIWISNGKDVELEAAVKRLSGS